MLEIKPACQDDLAQVLALYAVIEDAPSQPADLALSQGIFERMQQYPDYKVYLAYRDGIPVGTFALLIMDNLAHGGARSGVVEDVAVHPDYQGQGIGKQMMTFALQRCRETGCYKLALSSNIKREGAHRFYESIGFEQHGLSFIVRLDE